MRLYGVVDEIAKNGHMWRVFKRTPPMSANMVSFVVLDFHHEISNGEHTFVVVSPLPSNNEYHTLQRGLDAIQLFEENIGIKSDFSRILMVAALGAEQEPMGTCGLIFGR